MTIDMTKPITTTTTVVPGDHKRRDTQQMRSSTHPAAAMLTTVIQGLFVRPHKIGFMNCTFFPNLNNDEN